LFFPCDFINYFHVDNHHSLGRIPYPFPDIRKLMMIAVGVGIAPFLQMLRHLFKSYDRRIQNATTAVDLDDIHLNDGSESFQDEPQIDEIVLFYGVVYINCYFPILLFIDSFFMPIENCERYSHERIVGRMARKIFFILPSCFLCW
jgi:hypothetical protein